MRWLGSNHFLVIGVNMPFELTIESYFWVASYFETLEHIKFVNKNGKLYASLQNLTFRVPDIKAAQVFKETFFNGEYDFFNVRNGVVIDIGAYIGDTALFFARSGAKKVVAYEPDPTFAEMAKENVALNGYTDRITVVNKAVGEKDGILQLASNCKVKQVSIKSVLNTVDSVDLMKMDCEGAEWEIMEKSINEALLEKVDKIVMEVHGLHPERMKKVLKRAKYNIKQVTSYGKESMLIAAAKD